MNYNLSNKMITVTYYNCIVTFTSTEPLPEPVNISMWKIDRFIKNYLRSFWIRTGWSRQFPMSRWQGGALATDVLKLKKEAESNFVFVKRTTKCKQNGRSKSVCLLLGWKIYRQNMKNCLTFFSILRTQRGNSAFSQAQNCVVSPLFLSDIK
jgi:hypothetical protein